MHLIDANGIVLPGASEAQRQQWAADLASPGGQTETALAARYVAFLNGRALPYSRKLQADVARFTGSSVSHGAAIAGAQRLGYRVVQDRDSAACFFLKPLR